MKNLIILPFLIAGFANAQSSNDSFNFASQNIQSDYMSRIMSIEVPRLDFDFDLFGPDQANPEFQSDYQIITPNQFMLTNYPNPDFSNMTNLFMGSAVSQSFSIGNKKLTQTYLFDINGTLRSSQLSISFGKDD